MRPNGDLFVSNIVDSATGTVSVLPRLSGSEFGVRVTAGVLTSLPAASALRAPGALAFDTAGDLFILDAPTAGQDAWHSLWVLPSRSGTVFGHQARAGHLMELAAGGLRFNPSSLAFSQEGDLFLTSLSTKQWPSGAISEIPNASGTTYGEHVHADRPSALVTSSIYGPTALTFGRDGELLFSQSDATIAELPVP